MATVGTAALGGGVCGVFAPNLQLSVLSNSSIPLDPEPRDLEVSENLGLWGTLWREAEKRVLSLCSVLSRVGKCFGGPRVSPSTAFPEAEQKPSPQHHPHCSCPQAKGQGCEGPRAEQGFTD